MAIAQGITVMYVYSFPYPSGLSLGLQSKWSVSHPMALAEKIVTTLTWNRPRATAMLEILGSTMICMKKMPTESQPVQRK